ncbi:MAG: cation:proton antiporter [Rikenellaceae bacterium]
MFQLLSIHSLLETPIENPILKFLVILAIILFAPLVLNKIRVPHILGLIIAGAVVGPFGLNLILRDDGIVLSGTVGLLYIMFIAGLEIDMNEFIRNSRKSIVFGLFTFVIPMLLGTLTGLYLLNYTMMTSILLASMFASHTLLTYPIISKLGVKRNRAVTVAIGGTVIAETLALLILAVVVGMTQGEVNTIFWVSLSLKLLIFSVVIFLVFPIITRAYFKRISDGLSQYIFVLFMLFMGATLAEFAGIEGIIGALFTGLALNRLIPHASALMNRVEFIGNAIFIPFFLISVGMLIDYRVFLSDWHVLYTAAVMTVIATLAKYLAAYCTQKSFGYSSDERSVIFGLSNARAAATLAVVLVGYNIIMGYAPDGEPIRLLDSNILNGTIVMIFVTCTIASFSAQRGAYNLSMAKQIDLDSHEEEVDRILLPINALDSTGELLSFANLMFPKSDENLISVAVIIGEKHDDDEQLIMAKKIFEKAHTKAASADRAIDTTLRYDTSYTNGIANIIREGDVKDLVIAVDSERFMTRKLPSKIIDGTAISSCVNTFMYRSCQPIATIKRHIVVVPPNAESELGFRDWIIRVWTLLRSTGASALVYGNAATLMVIERLSESVNLPIKLREYRRYQDILIISRDLKADDGLIFVMSKTGNPSYHHHMDSMPHYINTYFAHSNFVLIYPFQHGHQSGDLENITNIASVSAVSKIEEAIGSAAGVFSKSGKKG